MRRTLSIGERLKLFFRFSAYLFWEFRWSLAVFWSLVLGGGLILAAFYRHRPLTYGEGCYAIFMMIFVEAYLDFPDEWFLQPFFFVVPVIGLGAIADSLIRLGFLMFSRKQRLPEWHRMTASTYRNHFVVLGIGKVGYQVIKGFVAIRAPVVAIERAGAESVLIDEIVDLGVPIIRGDGRTAKVLTAAGVGRSRAVVLATSDDLTNLDAALTARDLNPKSEIVLRLFDESLAAKVRGAFAMPAISTAQVAAPAFIAAATGRKVYQSFKLGDQVVHLIDLTVRSIGGLVGMTTGEVQADGIANVVMHRRSQGAVNINPSGNIRLEAGDQMLVIAPIDRLLELGQKNEQPRAVYDSGDGLAPAAPPPVSIAEQETPAPGEAEHPATCDLDS
jgi:Trk K+ transport system NAD-binding subunit